MSNIKLYDIVNIKGSNCDLPVKRGKVVGITTISTIIPDMDMTGEVVETVTKVKVLIIPGMTVESTFADKLDILTK